MATVKVLVAQRNDGQVSGYWAEFEGEEVDSYKDERGDTHVVYTLYKSTAGYNYDAYRVHKADESDPEAPVYELFPFSADPQILRHDYTEPYSVEQVAAEYPLFVKKLDYLRTYHVDP